LRKTKHNRLANLTDSEKQPILLGKEGKEFKFEHLNPIQVDFVETSLYDASDELAADVEQIEEWLEKVAC